MNDTLLVAICSDIGTSPETICGAIDAPEFDKRTRVHDWRNYIPKPLEDAWHELSEETRIVAFAMAEMQAGNEDWD